MALLLKIEVIKIIFIFIFFITTAFREIVSLPTNSMKVHKNTFFLPGIEFSEKCSLVILNSDDVVNSKKLIEQIWNNCDYRICADGGANRLYDMFKDDPIYLPDRIKGDLDSVRDDTYDYYKSNGILITKDEDQDSNDLDKCIVEIVANNKNKKSTVLDIINIQ